MTTPKPLRELVAAATPGPYKTVAGTSYFYVQNISGMFVAKCHDTHEGVANAQLIARLSPEVVLRVYEALIEANHALRYYKCDVLVNRVNAALAALDGLTDDKGKQG